MPSPLAEAAAGRRLEPGEALALLEGADLLELGRAAREAALRILGDAPATFLVDRNVNYTNVCENRCRFCAFYRDAGHPEAYLLGHDAIEARVAEAVDLGATQVMLQGGVRADLGLEWFEGLFRRLKARFPGVQVHSLSPPEVAWLAKGARLTVRETLRRLAEAGLDSLPGGGAEVLVDHVRRRISPRKIGAGEWLSVMEEAQVLGMPTTATMMLGAGESLADRVEHLRAVRELQDRTGGFLSFIPWTFQPGNTELGAGGASVVAYLRLLAVARLFLDNVRNVQGSWVTQGPEIGQVALHFGANDLGSVMLEENVVRAAGTSHRMSVGGMVDLILGAGRVPAQRDTRFNVIRRFDA